MADPVRFFDAIQPTIDKLDAATNPQRFPVVRTTRTEPRAEIPRETRVVVYMRDNFQCQWCGSGARLQLDHIIPWSAGGSDDTSNLRTLCAECNSYRSNFDIDTEVRRPPVACGCDTCVPEWDIADHDGFVPSPVFCLYCKRIGRGAIHE